MVDIANRSVIHYYHLFIAHPPSSTRYVRNTARSHTDLLPLWTSKRGGGDIKQIITCMESVLKRQSVRADKGITYLEVTWGCSGVRKGLPEEVMYKLRSRG